MRLLCLGTASSLFLLASQSFAASSADLFSKAPLRFEALTPTQWVAHGPGFAVGFSPRGTQFQLGARGVTLTFEDSNPNAPFQGAKKSAHPSNYFGSRSHSADAFLRLRQTEVYPGIDVVYYGEGAALEYDFELAPGADPSPIRMRFSGPDRVSLNEKGELILLLNGNEITQKAPVVYQRRPSGEVVGVESSYFTEDDGSVRLKLGNYDRAQGLVIDPLVHFQAYLGGSGSDSPISIQHDKNNTIYVAGRTFSPDFNNNGTPYNNTFPSNPTAVFISVLNPLSTNPDDVIPYSGFFTGAFGDDLNAMTVDNDGVVYFAGTTGDVSFPITANAISKTTGGINAKVFISVLDTRIPGTAGLQYSTFFAGSQTDLANGIAVANGLIYVTGSTTSDDFPLANAFQTTRAGGIFDAFVSVIDPKQAGTAGLIFSSYLGGASEDIGRSVTVAPDGQIWVGGSTFSSNFPTTIGSAKPFYSGGGDGFLARVNPTSASVTYSTFLGGTSQDQVKKILLDPQGRVAATGYTLSADFPSTANALQPVMKGPGDAFFMILDPNAVQFTQAIVYSTFFGGSDGDVAYDMRRDKTGKYYLCGYTLSRDFPVLNAYYPVSAQGGTDGWVSVIDPAQPPASALIYSSYVTSTGFQVAYSVDVDSNGIIYLVGSAFGNVFAPGRPIPPVNSNTNVFFLVFELDPPAGQPAVTTLRKAPRNTGTRVSSRPSAR